MVYRSGLRDLSQKIRDLAREHKSFSQVSDIVSNACDHIDAVAHIEEMHQILGGKR